MRAGRARDPRFEGSISQLAADHRWDGFVCAYIHASTWATEMPVGQPGIRMNIYVMNPIEIRPIN